MKNTCRFCGNDLGTERRANALFCDNRGKCRAAYSNRRLWRGAILYDLFMALRFERTAAEEAGIWSAMCRLASIWREEDRTQTEAPSWANWKAYLERNPHLTGREGRL